MDTTQFTLTPPKTEEDKYWRLEYIGYEPNSIHFDVFYSNFTLCQDEENANELMDAILKLEKDMGVLLKERGLKHNPKKIIRFYFTHLENILIGIDVRAKWSWEKKVEAYVEWFDARYNEAYEYCNVIHQTVEEFNPEANWKVQEKYRRYIETFDLDFPMKLNWGEDFFSEAVEILREIDINAAINVMQQKMKSYGF